MSKVGQMVKVNPEFAKKNSIPDFPAIILRGPYEKQIKLTKEYTACEMMVDLLINGQIYKIIPIKFCNKV